MKNSGYTRDLTIEDLRRRPTLLLTPREVGQILGASYDTVRRLISSGILPSIVFGNSRRRVVAHELLRFVGLAPYPSIESTKKEEEEEYAIAESHKQ